MKSMAPLALKAWVTSVGIAVVLNSDQFFIAGLRGASQIPPYRAAYVMFLNVNMLAVTFASSSSVFVAQLWQSGDKGRVHRMVQQNLRLGLLIMADGGACILALGPRLSNAWLGRGNYVGAGVELIFFLLLFMEAQSFIIATSSRATEDEAFAVWTTAAAALKVSLSLILGAKFGLVGIAVATLAAQLLTNHWFMCYRGLRRLGISLRSHLRLVLVPVAASFAITFAVVRALATTLSSQTDATAVAAALVASACLLGGAIWRLVLSESAKQHAVAYPGRMLRLLWEQV